MGIRTEVADERPTRGISSVVIAGGGTGGHLFPGIALAEEFVLRNPACRIRFVSSGRPLEERVLAETGFEVYRLAVEGLKGRGVMAKLKTAFRLPLSLLQALRMLRRVRPDVVIGMGGYSAGPVVLAAWMLRYDRVICEQNRLPGITNRILSRFAGRIYVGFSGTFAGGSAEKQVVTGNPVRRRIRESLISVPDQTAEKSADFTAGRLPEPAAQKSTTAEMPADGRADRFTVLILGGSQGAHGINMAVVGALDHLAEKAPAADYYFIHQTGEKDRDAVAAAYAQKGFPAMVASFFTEMAALYRQADLVICRAGATTVAEIAVAGNAAVFVPFPHAADDHQRHNAAHLVDAGAAEMILEKDLMAAGLAEKINYYRRHPEALAAMRDAMGRFARPEAAETIVDDIFALVQTRKQKGISRP
jgi:UDP-N-acetylglucosamine--N-acetylmuramyl-(pentapeptide) pyrophosphoryl-undecaprenol N-acetylglucosamine transferase